MRFIAQKSKLVGVGVVKKKHAVFIFRLQSVRLWEGKQIENPVCLLTEQPKKRNYMKMRKDTWSHSAIFEVKTLWRHNADKECTLIKAGLFV